jgi:preprotein translocase subunit SecB
MQPPLELQDYWIEELLIRANPEYIERKTAPEISPEIDFAISKAPGQKKFLICMTIGIQPEEDVKLSTPYRIVVTLSGHYCFRKETDEQTIKRMLAPNGLAILYGIARATVAQATACGRHGKFLLPTVDLVEIIRSKINAPLAVPDKREEKKSRKKKA